MLYKAASLPAIRPILQDFSKVTNKGNHRCSTQGEARSSRHGHRHGEEGGGGEGDERVVRRAPQGGAPRPPQRLRPQFHPPVSVLRSAPTPGS